MNQYDVETTIFYGHPHLVLIIPTPLSLTLFLFIHLIEYVKLVVPWIEN